MDANRAKEICKEYEFEMTYIRQHDPGWSINNPKNDFGHDMPNVFFKGLSEREFIRYMENIKNGVIGKGY